MANIKFTQLPNQGIPTDATIVPTVAGGTNYTITGANLKTYVNSTTGNITAGYFIGNGSALTGLPATYGNSNVDAHLAAFGANTISTSGNVTAGYFAGNGSLLTGLPANYGNSNVTLLLASFGSNAISTTGNITAGYVKGNISAATGGYGNSNVQTVLQTYTGSMTTGTLSASGNITAAYFVGNGSALTGVTATLGGTMASNISGASTYSITNLVSLSASGNITGVYRGDGANLTGIPTSIVAGTGISVSASTGAVTITNANPTPYTNANVAAFLPTYTGNLAGGNLSITGQTSLVGQLTSSNAITTSGTITGGNVVGNHFGSGGNLSNIVTSITAGPGISVNAGTGAVTVSGTGANSISSGTSNISILTANGNIAAVAGGVQQLTIYNFTANATNGFTPLIATGLQVQNRLLASGNLDVNGTAMNLSTTVNGGTFGVSTNPIQLQSYYEKVATGLTTSTSFTPATSTGVVLRVTATANFALNTPTGMYTGQSISLIIQQDATGNRVMTPNAAYKFAYGVKTLSTAANAIDMMTIFYDGTNYLCNLVRGYA